MKKLLNVAWLAVGIAALPVRAGEVGLLLDKQVGASQSATVPVLGNVSTDAVKPNGFGLRGAFTVLDLKVAELGIAATYHPETKSDLVGNALGMSGKFGDYKNSYIAIGAQVDWKFLVNLHAGVDLRRESLSSEFTGDSKHDTTYTRPWIKAGIGFSIPTPVVSPFVRLEVAMATTTAGSLNANSSDDDFNKAMAPKYQIGLYGGIRF